MICHEGDMTVGFANGVEYVLRFGDITGKGRADADAEGEKKDDAAKADDKPADGAAEGSNTAPNRYLFVTARFNESLIPKPKLTELPPETPATPPAVRSEEPDADEKKPEPAKAGRKETREEKKPADDKPAERCRRRRRRRRSTPTTRSRATKKKDEGSCDQEAGRRRPRKPTKKADEPKPTRRSRRQTGRDAKPADAKPAMTPTSASGSKAENKAKQDKYDADVKAGREKAKELNDKFADWFYVVSDATFQSINVDPTALIRKKTGDAADAAAMPAAPGGLPGLPNLDLLAARNP